MAEDDHLIFQGIERMSVCLHTLYVALEIKPFVLHKQGTDGISLFLRLAKAS